jgi:hypothetical protein
MEANDRFDKCYKLAEFWAGRHDARRSYEWKVALGLWAVILAAIHYAPDIRGGVRWNSCYTLVSLAAVWVIYFRFWLFPLWQRNKKDSRQAFFYADQAKLSLVNPDHAVQTIEPKDITTGFLEFCWDWAPLFHIITTALLLLAFWLAFTGPIEPPCSGH